MPTETAKTITMPQLGESVTEGTIGNWLKQVGDQVEQYEPLAEVVTDKVNAEIPSPFSGTLVEILVEPNTTVPVGAELCRIEESGVAAPTAEPPSEPAAVTTPPQDGNGRVAQTTVSQSPVTSRQGEIPDEIELLRARSSPVVRRIAKEHGIEIAQVDGTGIGGRVTKQDLLAHIDNAHDQAPQEPAAVVPPLPSPAPIPAPPPPATATPEPDAQPLAATGRIEALPGDEVIPLTPMRRMIAEHMVRSARTAPHASVSMEVDMTNVVAYRAARKDQFREREGIDLTYLPFAIKAATLALRDHPRLNAAWDEDRIIHRKAINVGVAVALEDGLVVPVIKNADRLSLAGLMHAVAEFADRARTGTLAPDDLTGGTFTVNNPGTFGSLVSTPILVQPQVAILSTEAIIKRPAVINDMIAIRSLMNLSLSIDHRVLDGLAATRFLQQVKQWLERVNEDLAL